MVLGNMVFGNNVKRTIPVAWTAFATFFCCLLAGLLLPLAAQAHSLGVGVEIAGQTVVLRCRYADGYFPDAEVLVYSPDEPDRAFQTGRTDRDGVFSFVPNTNGAWSVVVDDGMGHSKAVEVAVGGSVPVAREPLFPPLLRLAAAAVCLAALGFYLGRVSQKRTSQGESSVEGS